MKDDEKLRRIMEELAKKGLDPSQLGRAKETKSADELVFDVLEISPQTARTGRVLFDVVDRVHVAVQENGLPEVEEFFDQYGELRLLPRFGYSAQLYDAYIPFYEAGTRFLRDEQNHYNNPKTQRKFKKQPELQAYANKYGNFPNRIHAVTSAMQNELSYWMRPVVPQEVLGSDNRLINHQEKNLGHIVHELSKELSKRRAENLKLSEFHELCQLFLWQVEHELEVSPEIRQSQTSSDHTLAKLLFELAAGIHTPPVDARGKLPKNLEAFYLSGVDMYNLFIAFFQEFTRALTDAEHPTHQTAVKLMTALNQFSLPETVVPPKLSSQPFSFQFSFGLMQRDVVDNANYQEMILNVHQLSQSESENREWYQALFDYIVTASSEFSYRVLFTADATERELFDTTKDMPEMTDLSDSLQRVLLAGDSAQVTTIVSSHRLPIDEVPLQGSHYISYLHARRVAKGSYIVNIDLRVAQDQQTDAEFIRNGVFRYQVRVNNGETTVYLPLIDREDASDELNKASREFAQYIFHLIDQELQENEVAQRDLAEAGRVSRENAYRKPGNRAERIEEYNKRKAAEQEGEFNIHIDEQKEEQFYVLTSAEEDAVSPFLPSEIIVSESMRREMEKRSKKGSYARIYGETAEFIEKYNEAGESKPGRGYQLTDVYGPNNENVWRFRVTYGIRCIVADLGGGRALMISAEDHDDAYGDVTEIRRRVANEIAKYWRETGQD